MLEETSSIIILNGASSSGKTTLCRALQDVLPEPYILLEEDRFVYGTYHPKYLQPGSVEEIFRKTMLGYYRSLRAFALSGHHVLADTGFYSLDLVKMCVLELSDMPVWMIGVHCSLGEMERREALRADRDPGTAREQYETIHAHVIYDMTVDTSKHDATQCANEIAEAIGNGLPRLAMRNLSAMLALKKQENEHSQPINSMP